MRLLITLAAGMIAAPAFAQTPPTIDPGMTRAQVVAKLGEPLSSRTYDGHTYLLYKNGCEKKCGMNDLVVLDSGKVVDAVFRSRMRKYSGTSSSPRMISAADAKHGAGAPLKTPDTPTKKPPVPKPVT
ncbi:MAG: outer membrane protein assembly factor BamE [Deltaproteobacteria bacterium]